MIRSLVLYFLLLLPSLACAQAPVTWVVKPGDATKIIPAKVTPFLVEIPAASSLTHAGLTTNGGLLKANASGVISQTGAGTSTTILHGGTSPSYSAVSLTADIAGTLPIANGGTASITAAGARTALGSTTLGDAIYTITNPGAITFPRFNADNTVTPLSAANFDTAVGLGTGNTPVFSGLTLLLSDAATNSVSTGTTFGHNSSGSPAVGFGTAYKFQIQTATTADTDAADVTVTWSTATPHALRKARVVHNVWDSSAREAIRIQASGSAAMIGFLGATASAQLISPDAGTALVTFGLSSGTPTFAGANVTGTVPLATSAGACTGNSLTATTLATTRAIYGNNFDGSAALTQIIASTYGGTGNGFAKFSGPTTSEKTFTLPNASSTLLYDAGPLGTPASGDLTNCTFPTLNQNTTGSAAKLSISGQTATMTFTGLASTNRIKTVRDAADTILELGGSYTPSGTWTSMGLASPTITTPTISGAITFPDNVRQTFNPGANASGLNIGAQTTDPDTPSNGDLYYDSDDHLFRARINSAWVSLGAGGSGLTVGTTTITSGTTGRILYDNAGVVGEMTTTGSGTVVALATSPSFTTPILGTPTSATLTNATGLPAAGVVGTAAILGANTFSANQTISTGAGAGYFYAINTNASTGLRFGVQSGGDSQIFHLDDFSLNFGCNATQQFTIKKNGNSVVGGVSPTVGTGATCNLIFGGTSAAPTTSPVIGAATADLVHVAGVDKAAGDRRLYIQSESGSSISLGNDRLNFAASTGLLSIGGTDVLSTTSTVSTFASSISANGKATIDTNGVFTKYNNITTVSGGVPAIRGTGRATGQTAANTSVATYTVGAADATFIVDVNVLVTTSTMYNFTVTCAYTDEGNTARTITLPFVNLAGTAVAAITIAAGAAPYEGIPLHIRAKASTVITIATTGNFTSVTYNVEGRITEQ